MAEEDYLVKHTPVLESNNITNGRDLNRVGGRSTSCLNK